VRPGGAHKKATGEVSYSTGAATALIVCQAMIIAMTVVLPAAGGELQRET